MTMIRDEARRKGLRMAAHVAVLSGVLAAVAAGQAGAAEVKAPAAVEGKGGNVDGSESGSGEGQGSAGTAESLADLVRVSSKGNCGCSPCWGPPAPPAMAEELLGMFEEVV